LVQRLFKRASVVVVVLSGRVGLELELGALLVLAKCCAIAFGRLVENQQAWSFFEARVQAQHGLLGKPRAMPNSFRRVSLCLVA
jgi:sorbitol-specific phosphotransferase system component IIC